MKRFVRSAAYVVAFLASLALSPQLLASQASCVMPTTGLVSGLVLVNDINACNQALISLYSGGSAPSGPVAGMFWYNTATGFIQQYDGTAWANLWFVDSTNHLVTPPIGGGAANATITAAVTTDLGSIPQSFKTIVGAPVSITSFGSSAIRGSIHVVKFGTIQGLVQNGTSMILIGGASFTVTAGDIIHMIHLGSGNWQMLSYTQVALAPVAAAYSFLGNAGAGGANRSDITIPGLPQKVTPVGADKLLIADSAASNASKYVRADALAALAGVVSIDTRQGPFTTSNGLESTGGNVLQLSAARRQFPTVTVLTSGTNLTYTVPTNTLWLEIKGAGGGGGGGGGNNAGVANSGTSTCFAASGTACSSPIWTANGGTGGAFQTSSIGGTAGGGYSNITGTGGGAGSPPALNYNGVGGNGGNSCFGGAGGGSVSNGTGVAAAVNSGSGGGGGGASNGTLTGGGGIGGASGGCVTTIINAPAASYTYTIGTGGAGAAGGSISSSSGGAGGAGADGRIEIIEHYGT